MCVCGGFKRTPQSCRHMCTHLHAQLLSVTLLLQHALLYPASHQQVLRCSASPPTHSNPGLQAHNSMPTFYRSPQHALLYPASPHTHSSTCAVASCLPTHPCTLHSAADTHTSIPSLYLLPCYLNMCSCISSSHPPTRPQGFTHAPSYPASICYHVTSTCAPVSCLPTRPPTQHVLLYPATHSLNPRAAGTRLIACIKRGDQDSALAALASCSPGAAWCRDQDDSRGSYPIHLAAEAGMERLVQTLLAIPGGSWYGRDPLRPVATLLRQIWWLFVNPLCLPALLHGLLLCRCLPAFLPSPLLLAPCNPLRPSPTSLCTPVPS